MLTLAGIICALQHLQLCNSHQGAVWLWMYIYIYSKKCQPSQNSKCKMYCSGTLGGFVSLSVEQWCREQWEIQMQLEHFHILLRTGSLQCCSSQERENCSISLSNFTRRKLSLTRNTLRNFYRKCLSFCRRQRNSAEINDVIVSCKWITELTCNLY